MLLILVLIYLPSICSSLSTFQRTSLLPYNLTNLQTDAHHHYAVGKKIIYDILESYKLEDKSIVYMARKSKLINEYR